MSATRKTGSAAAEGEAAKNSPMLVSSACRTRWSVASVGLLLPRSMAERDEAESPAWRASSRRLVPRSSRVFLSLSPTLSIVLIRRLIVHNTERSDNISHTARRLQDAVGL